MKIKSILIISLLCGLLGSGCSYETPYAQQQKYKALDGAIITDDNLRDIYNRQLMRNKELEIDHEEIVGNISRYQALQLKLELQQHGRVATMPYQQPTNNE